jgi:hypothetical protein
VINNHYSLPWHFQRVPSPDGLAAAASLPPAFLPERSALHFVCAGDLPVEKIPKPSISSFPKENEAGFPASSQKSLPEKRQEAQRARGIFRFILNIGYWDFDFS